MAAATKCQLMAEGWRCAWAAAATEATEPTGNSGSCCITRNVRLKRNTKPKIPIPIPIAILSFPASYTIPKCLCQTQMEWIPLQLRNFSSEFV